MNRSTMTTVTTAFAWIVAAALSIGFAVWYPTESSVMGQMPAHSTQTLTRTPVSLPAGLPSDRTLALVTFNKNQRVQADSWIDGMNLRNDSSISWVRIPVLGDLDTPDGRSDGEKRLLERYTVEAERARMLPMFMDKKSFARATGLSNTDQGYAVVLNREGEVLARVEGSFDPNKAELLRETLGLPAK